MMTKTGLEPTERGVIKFVHGRNYRPMTIDELADTFHIGNDERDAFIAMVKELEYAGELVEVKKKRLADPARVDLIVGTLLCNARGFGFVQPVRPSDGAEDIYVSGENMSSAFHGDVVAVHVARAAGQRRGRGAKPPTTEAKVVSVVRRKRTEIVGTFLQERDVRYVVPDDPRLFRDVVISPENTGGARPRDKVAVRITVWPTRHLNPAGVVTTVFGPRGQMEAERASVIHEFSLRDAFPKPVVSAARRLKCPKSADELAGREDLTDEQIFTIDPEDARDFDDAVSLAPLPGGGWELAVHIADVSHYLLPDGPIDEEARLRGTSVYLPGQVIPMLPEELSNDVCSLKPNEIRLTKTVRMRLDTEGRVRDAKVYDSFIRSVRRFTYEEVQAVLDGGPLPGEEPLRRILLQMNGVAELMRARRRDQGMIEIDVPEAHVVTDAEGRTTGIVLRHSDASHKLIEQFMLAANEAVAGYLLKHKLPYICRAHAEPDPEAIAEFRESAQAMGHRLPNPGTREQIQRFLERVKNSPEAPVLHYLLLRSMMQAQYSAEDRAHWAIGARHYLHFTSPIRRYPDLLVHRILDEARNGRLKEPRQRAHWDANLPLWAIRATECERNAEAAERLLNQRRVLEYVADLGQELKAVITGVENYGLRISLCDYLLSGVVRLSDLRDGFYRVDRERHQLTGPAGRRYRLGSVIVVKVKRYDEFKRQIDFEPVGRISKPRSR